VTDRETLERIARNEATFREANERIEEAAEEHALETGPIPFICECADPSCAMPVQLTLEEYRAVRTGDRRFVVAPGHEESTATEVVERHAGFLVLEKQGRAGAVAEELADG
jgi:hypothetical protein